VGQHNKEDTLRTFTRHHIQPRSRKGNYKHNIVRLPREFHQMWHALFFNLTPCDVYEFIDRLMVADTRWTAEDINDLRRKVKRK
jgi:DNA-binding ferritin-like protein (Dps family)